MKLGIISTKDSVSVLMFLRLPRVYRTALLAQAGTIDAITLGQLARATLHTKGCA